MFPRQLASLLLAVGLVAPVPVFGTYHEERGERGRSDLAPGRARTEDVLAPKPTDTPLPSSREFVEAGRKGKLRRPEHAGRLEKVAGVILGMTNKLTNLSDELARTLAKHEERIANLRSKGFDITITVDERLAAARAAVAAVQEAIGDVLGKLREIPDSEAPRGTVREVKPLISGVRPKVREARDAFSRLRQAVRDDVRASRRERRPLSPEASVTPKPTPTLEPTLTPSPRPLPF